MIQTNACIIAYSTPLPQHEPIDGCTEIAAVLMLLLQRLPAWQTHRVPSRGTQRLQLRQIAVRRGHAPARAVRHQRPPTQQTLYQVPWRRGAAQLQQVAPQVVARVAGQRVGGEVLPPGLRSKTPAKGRASVLILRANFCCTSVTRRARGVTLQRRAVLEPASKNMLS